MTLTSTEWRAGTEVQSKGVEERGGKTASIGYPFRKYCCKEEQRMGP